MSNHAGHRAAPVIRRQSATFVGTWRRMNAYAAGITVSAVPCTTTCDLPALFRCKPLSSVQAKHLAVDVAVGQQKRRRVRILVGRAESRREGNACSGFGAWS